MDGQVNKKLKESLSEPASWDEYIRGLLNNQSRASIKVERRASLESARNNISSNLRSVLIAIRRHLIVVSDKGIKANSQNASVYEALLDRTNERVINEIITKMEAVVMRQNRNDAVSTNILVALMEILRGIPYAAVSKHQKLNRDFIVLLKAITELEIFLIHTADIKPPKKKAPYVVFDGEFSRVHLDLVINNTGISPRADRLKLRFSSRTALAVALASTALVGTMVGMNYSDIFNVSPPQLVNTDNMSLPPTNSPNQAIRTIIRDTNTVSDAARTNSASPTRADNSRLTLTGSVVPATPGHTSVVRPSISNFVLSNATHLSVCFGGVAPTAQQLNTLVAHISADSRVKMTIRNLAMASRSSFTLVLGSSCEVLEVQADL